MGRGSRAPFVRSTLVVTAGTAAALLAPAFAGAATLTVDTTDEFSATDCSLSEAITSANINSDFGSGCDATDLPYGDDTINITATGTINLSGGLTPVTSNIDFNGPGPGQLDIHRDTGGGYRVMNFNSTSNSSLSGVTISNGHLPTFTVTGAGIGNFGTLLLEDVIVRDNVVAVEEDVLNPSPDGGGIVNVGTLTVRASTITNNSISSTQTATAGPTSADAQGGGIFSTGTLTVQRSTVTGNTASAEVMSDDEDADALAVGGGIATQGGTATIRTSTITGNTTEATAPVGFDATRGGGISNLSATLTAVGDTIAGNSAEFSASISAQGTETVTDTILANDLLADNCDGMIDTDGGFNLSFPSDCAGLNPTIADPQLRPLADNGGPTETMALGATSPAIDQGTSAGNPTDQRLMPRPTDIAAIADAPLGDGSDIGALEAKDSDGDGVNDDDDACLSLQGPVSAGGCPIAEGTLTIKYSKKNKRFKGALETPGYACFGGRGVDLYRKLAGPDKPIGQTLTEADGSYALDKKAKRGKRYYAQVTTAFRPDVAQCAEASSPTIKVK